MRRILSLLCWVGLASVLLGYAQTGAQPNTESGSGTQAVPVLDGGAGPCAVEFTINSPEGKPVFGAKVNVHVAYGFGGFHKLDLEASTNSDGKVKFTGIPPRVRRSQLEFEATKDQRAGSATVDPATECHAQREIRLAAKNVVGGDKN